MAPFSARGSPAAKTLLQTAGVKTWQGAIMTSSSFEVLELAGTLERRGRLGFGGLFLFEVGVAFCSCCQSGAQKRLFFSPN